LVIKKLDDTGLTPAELQMLLETSIKYRHHGLTDYLVSTERSGAPPTIDYPILRELMMGSAKAKNETTFVRVLEIAAAQTNAVDNARMAKKMALHRGNLWESAWTKYEKVYFGGR
jgi:hypothetical protein